MTKPKKGVRDTGNWDQDPSDRICIKWRRHNPGVTQCFTVTMEGRRVWFKSAKVQHKTYLRGSIAETFLTPRKKSK